MGRWSAGWSDSGGFFEVEDSKVVLYRVLRRAEPGVQSPADRLLSESGGGALGSTVCVITHFNF